MMKVTRKQNKHLRRQLNVSYLIIMYYEGWCYCSKPGEIESLLLQVGVEAFLDFI